MHDGLGQTLSYLGLMTDQVVDFFAEGRAAALDHLRKSREAINKATSDVHRAINRLMEDPLPAQNLYDRLRAVLEEKTPSQYDLELVWQPEPDSVPECPPVIADQIIQIASKGLINTARHVWVWKVNIFAGRRGEENFVTVENCGRGFDSDQPTPNGHFSLQIMRACAEHIGGRIDIQSVVEKGTRVTLWWKA